ncbi:MAG TPA: hypothetical protein VE035_04475 [Puia sp.]|nr:hypothetical protein [Puia sp.]
MLQRTTICLLAGIFLLRIDCSGQFTASGSPDNGTQRQATLSANASADTYPRSYIRGVDSLADKLANFPSKLFGRIQSKTAAMNKSLTDQTEKYLQRMAKQEARLRKKLFKIDSSAARTLFDHSAERYAALAQKLKQDSGSRSTNSSGEYYAYADSLKTAMAFLQQNPQLLGASSAASVTNAGIPLSDATPGLPSSIASLTSSANLPPQLQSSYAQLQQLQAKMQDAGEIQQFIQQRKAQIQQCLARYTNLPSGITNAYNGYKQQLYYYDQQVHEYKEMLNDPDKLFKKALELLDRLPAFTNFVKSNSMLSSLLSLPGGAAVPGQIGGANATGMPTRDQVIANIQGQMGAPNAQATPASGATAASSQALSSDPAVAVPNASTLVSQNVGSAQGQIDQLRDKLNSGGSGADLDMPNFKPNAQRTKTFLQRLEYGTNLQSTHSNYYFPTTTDIGLSIGYKLDDNNRVGIGASYKVGWGQDISHVNVSSQGAGLRSFLDIRLKKTFFASGGFEYNYQQPFYSLNTVRDLNEWQQSGLIGISKIISMKTKVFKNTKIQLLWDFLSYEQVPRTQALKFRLGYSF